MAANLIKLKQFTVNLDISTQSIRTVIFAGEMKNEDTRENKNISF